MKSQNSYDIGRALTKDLQSRRLLPLSEVAPLFGYSIRTLQRRVADGHFLEPRRKPISGRIHGWFLDELLEYRANQPHI